MRPLTDLGKDEDGADGACVRLLGVKPDAILTSPLVRARETAEIVASELGLRKPAISDELAPDGTMAGVLNDILNAGPLRQVLLAGHMPGVGRMVGYLAWSSSDTIVPFRTAAVCRVDLPDDAPYPAPEIFAGCCHLVLPDGWSSASGSSFRPVASSDSSRAGNAGGSSETIPNWVLSRPLATRSAPRSSCGC